MAKDKTLEELEAKKLAAEKAEAERLEAEKAQMTFFDQEIKGGSEMQQAIADERYEFWRDR